MQVVESRPALGARTCVKQRRSPPFRNGPLAVGNRRADCNTEACIPTVLELVHLPQTQDPIQQGNRRGGSMNLIPTQEEVLAILRETGALRTGHFEDSNGLHSGQHLEPALAMRYYRHAEMLSVGLSRLLRADRVIRPIIPELSMVATTVGGLPVAYGLCEALHARQVYWAEKESQKGLLHFRQYLEQTPG